MSFRKTIFFFFFLASIAKLSEHFACAQSYLSGEKKRTPSFQSSLWETERNCIFSHPGHAEISVANTGRGRGEKYWVGVERNERLFSEHKKITQVLKCPPAPTQTKGGLVLIFLRVTRV